MTGLFNLQTTILPPSYHSIVLATNHATILFTLTSSHYYHTTIVLTLHLSILPPYRNHAHPLPNPTTTLTTLPYSTLPSIQPTTSIHILTGTQPYLHPTTTPPSHHTILPSFHHTTLPSSYHTIPSSFQHTILLPSTHHTPYQPPLVGHCVRT